MRFLPTGVGASTPPWWASGDHLRLAAEGNRKPTPILRGCCLMGRNKALRGTPCAEKGPRPGLYHAWPDTF